MAETPRLTIGLPVFNGAEFLEAAATALLEQTYTDFELVICDDGSTDGTAGICARLMARDRRVRLVLRSANGGAADNFNAAFAQCRTELFKWAAHDDLHDPAYLERCVAALDAEPRAALAHTRARSIAVDGSVMRPDWGEPAGLGSSDPVERFRASMAQPRNPIPLQMFAVMRTEILARTGMLIPIPDFDRALVAELALHGPFVEVPETLFAHQEHDKRMGLDLSSDSRSASRQLGGNHRFPHWRLLGRHLESVRRRPPGVPLRPLVPVVREWTVRHRQELTGDLIAAGARTPAVGPVVARADDRRTMARYRRQVDGFRHSVIGAVPGGEPVIVIDDDELVLIELEGRPCAPLIPMDSPEGSYPARAADAIAAVEQRRREGFTHLAIAWPAFWVLDYHRELAEYLDRDHRRLLADDDVVLYRLEVP
jgi:glycosyltransferase involved in cell wall biosynthesis